MSNISYPKYKLEQNITINSATASSGFSGSFYGDGSNLINLPIDAYTAQVAGNITGSGISSDKIGLRDDIYLNSVTASSKLISHGKLENGFTVDAAADFSHAEGMFSIAAGNYSHAEGHVATTYADFSHAEGWATVCYGTGSHAEGVGTITSASFQHVQGKFNQTSSTALALIGNGTSIERSNILEVYPSNINISGALNVTQVINAPQITSSFYGDGSSLYNVNASDIIITVINKTGEDIPRGTVVHITSSINSSDTPHITKADWTSDSLSANTLGLTYTDILDNNTGFVISEGILKSININSLITPSSGQVLYLSSSGLFTNIKPQSPKHIVSIGQITRASPTNNATIYVSIQNGYELSELHDVSASNATSGDILALDNSTGLWKNTKTLTGDYSITGSLSITNFISSSQMTGSFSGSGAGLYNIPLSAFDLSNYAKLNTENIFTTNQTVTGSFYVSSNIQSLGSITGSAITSSNTLQVGGQSNFGGGIRLPIKTVTGNYSLTASSDYIVAFSGSNLTGTLPAATGINGSTLVVKNLHTSSLYIIDGVSTIDGQPSLTVYNQYSSHTFVSDGTNWLIV